MNSTRRSIALSGKVTSLILEPEFWRFLDRLAEQSGLSWADYCRTLLDEAGATPNRAAALKQGLLRKALASGSAAAERALPGLNVAWRVECGGDLQRTRTHGALVTAGRAENCELVLADHDASRCHAAFIHADGAWWVLDLDSKNGTMVAGRRVERQRIAAGEVVTLGTSRIRLDGPIED